jgi:hypothetical protein
MKNLLFFNNYYKYFFLILTFSLLSSDVVSQCNNKYGQLSDGSKYYMHSREEVYSNDKVLDGVLAAYVSLFIVQNSSQPTMLQFLMSVVVGKNHQKEMVVPRKIIIHFIDYSKIEIFAVKLKDPTYSNGLTLQESWFQIEIEDFEKISKQAISRIIIIDTRKSTKIIGTPYKYILSEQANCILKAVN